MDNQNIGEGQETITDKIIYAFLNCFGARGIFLGCPQSLRLW